MVRTEVRRVRQMWVNYLVRPAEHLTSVWSVTSRLSSPAPYPPFVSGLRLALSNEPAHGFYTWRPQYPHPAPSLWNAAVFQNTLPQFSTFFLLKNTRTIFAFRDMDSWLPVHQELAYLVYNCLSL